MNILRTLNIKMPSKGWSLYEMSKWPLRQAKKWLLVLKEIKKTCWANLVNLWYCFVDIMNWKLKRNRNRESSKWASKMKFKREILTDHLVLMISAAIFIHLVLFPVVFRRFVHSSYFQMTDKQGLENLISDSYQNRYFCL